MTSIIPQDLYLQRLKQLDEKLIHYPLSDDFALALEEAYRFGKITDFQKKALLNDIVTAILYIIIPRENFKQEIIERLQISPAYAEIINQIIQQKIFEPLKNELEQYNHLLSKKSFEITKPLETPKAEIIKTKEIKELAQKPKPLPDLSLPEIQEIKIERPVNRTGELKRVFVPSVSLEAQERIHSKLMEAMNKKGVKPKIVEEMKKVVIEGIKKTPQQKPKSKATSETEESMTSQVIGGEGQKFNPQEKTQKSPSQKPYILDAKLKEEKEVEQELPKKEIEYRQPPPKKPFGEA